jgi:transcriptional regulator with XRE-family HTH domain
MDGDWAQLAKRLAYARKLAGLTQDELATALNLGKSSIQKMERPSTRWAKVAPMHRLAAAYFGWTPESIERVLRGKEPLLVSGDATAPAPTAPDERNAFDELTAGMSPRAIEALRRGSTVDTDVVDLAADEPDVEAVLIFKSREWEHVPPERKRIVLRKWAQLQLAAREIFSEEETPSP